MDYAAILRQINSLPFTFLRSGPTFGFVQNSRAAALFRYGNASDGLVDALTFSKASGVWLDAWGQLFTIPRNSRESDTSYVARIPATLVSGKGTPVAIAMYLLTAFGYTVEVTESFADVRWELNFDVPIDEEIFREIAAGLGYVRPAGVPGLAFVGVAGGMYVGSVNYLGAPKITGAYMLSPHGESRFNLSAFTNNTKPLLPTTFMTDPTINPGL